MSEALKNYLKGQFKSRKAFLDSIDGNDANVAALIQDIEDAPDEVKAAAKDIIGRNEGDVAGLVEDMADTVYGPAKRPSGIRGKKGTTDETVAERVPESNAGDKNTLPDPPPGKKASGKRTTGKPKGGQPPAKPKIVGPRSRKAAEPVPEKAPRKPPAAALNPDTGRMVKTKGVGSDTVAATGAGDSTAVSSGPMPPFFDPSMQMDTGPGAAPTFQVDAEREALYRANPFAFMGERAAIPPPDMPNMPDATMEGPDGEPVEFDPFTADVGTVMPEDQFNMLPPMAGAADPASDPMWMKGAFPNQQAELRMHDMGMLADTGGGALPTFQADATDAGMRQVNPMFGLDARHYPAPPEQPAPPAPQDGGNMIARLRQMFGGRAPSPEPVVEAPAATAPDPAPDADNPLAGMGKGAWQGSPATSGPAGPSRMAQLKKFLGAPFTSINNAAAPATIVPLAGVADRVYRNSPWILPTALATEYLTRGLRNGPPQQESTEDLSDEAMAEQEERMNAAWGALKPRVPASPMQ